MCACTICLRVSEKPQQRGECRSVGDGGVEIETEKARATVLTVCETDLLGKCDALFAVGVNATAITKAQLGASPCSHPFCDTSSARDVPLSSALGHNTTPRDCFSLPPPDTPAVFPACVPTAPIRGLYFAQTDTPKNESSFPPSPAALFKQSPWV